MTIRMRHEIFGVKIDDISTSELTDLFSCWLVENPPTARTIITPNPEFLLQAREDEEFRNIINAADVSLPDGVGIRFAVAALTPNLLTHRHTGMEALLLLANECVKKGKTLGLVGGRHGSAEKAAVKLRETVPGLSVFGFDPGRIESRDSSASSQNDKKIIERLQREKLDVLAIGLGQKKQELFLRHVAPVLLSLRIGIGVGGVFDVLSGEISSAPTWMRRSGLEWIWRLAQEPKRIRRIWNAVVIFPVIVVWHTLKYQSFLHALRRTIPEIIRQLFHFRPRNSA